jgi:hypothetical protein
VHNAQGGSGHEARGAGSLAELRCGSNGAAAQARLDRLGFTSTGPRSKRIGECRDNRCSDDGHLLYCAGFTLRTEGFALLDVDFEVVDPVKLWLLSRRRYLDGDPSFFDLKTVRSVFSNAEAVKADLEDLWRNPVKSRGPLLAGLPIKRCPAAKRRAPLVHSYNATRRGVAKG